MITDKMATIRLMEERDAGSLARDLSLSQQHISNRWQERLAGRRTMFVAEVDGEIVGSVAFEEREELPGLLHLFALGVVPPMQSQGIGRELIARVEQEARVRDLRGIHLGVAIENVEAQRLYERLGYRRIGQPYDARWTWYGPNGEQREVVERCHRMYKPIAPLASSRSASSRQAG